MAVQHATDQRAVVEFLATLAGEHPAVSELWWRPWNDEFQFWLFAAPADYDAEQDLHALQLALSDRFRDLLFDLDIVDIKYLAGKRPAEVVPDNAERIPLGRQ